MLLSSIIGNGFQLFLKLCIVFILSDIGFSKPEKSTNILSLIIILFFGYVFINIILTIEKSTVAINI